MSKNIKNYITEQLGEILDLLTNSEDIDKTEFYKLIQQISSEKIEENYKGPWMIRYDTPKDEVTKIYESEKGMKSSRAQYLSHLKNKKKYDAEKYKKYYGHQKFELRIYKFLNNDWECVEYYDQDSEYPS